MNRNRPEEPLLRPEDIDAGPLVEGIIDWVEMETPSERPDMIDLLLDHVAAQFTGLAVSVRRIPGRDGCGGQLVLSYAPPGVTGKSALLLGHIDTVWATGTLAERPVRREDDRIYGPGIFDMKAGSFLATETLRRIAAAGAIPPRPITVFLNSDEEIGSLTSRALIEELASEAAFVLVPEPAFEEPGTVVTSRKGWGRFRLKAFGRSSHAGGNLSDGRSAIHEIARQIVDIEGLTTLEPHATFNVGVVAGGTRSNVVPAEAVIEIDMRADDLATAERVTRDLLARQAYGPDIRLEIEGGINRPPFERSPAVARIYEATKTLAAALRLPMAETKRGGVSDGNFAAAMGLPVIDGLGCNGAGAHAVHEHIVASTVAPRAALLYGMLMSAKFQDSFA